MSKIAVIFNTRGRQSLLRQCIARLVGLADDLSNLTITLNIDEDDEETFCTAMELGRAFPNIIETRVSPRFVNCHVPINEMAFATDADLILPWGDDCFMVTPHWDKIAREYYSSFCESHPDGIALLAIESNSCDKILQYGWYPDTFLISKQGRDANGWLVHPYFISLGADVATFAVYANSGRAIDCRRIEFDHATHRTVHDVVNPDQTAREYRDRQAKLQAVDPFNYDYTGDITKLEQAIKEADTLNQNLKFWRTNGATDI